MKKMKAIVILAVLGFATSFTVKTEALPVPTFGPGTCGYWTLVMAGGVIPEFVWVSVPCPGN